MHNDRCKRFALSNKSPADPNGVAPRTKCGTRSQRAHGGTSMSKIKLAFAAFVMLAVAFIMTSPASAQMTNPNQGMGDYDEMHQWHDAGWWWANNPDWVRQNHPTW